MDRLEIDIGIKSPVPLAVVKGALTRHTVADAFKKLGPFFSKGDGLVLDVGGVSEIDSSGIALIGYGYKRLGGGPTGCTIKGMGPALAKKLELAGWDFNGEEALAVEPKEPFVESIGGGAEKAGQQLYYFAYIVSEVFYQAIIMPFRGARPRVGLFVEQMSRIGAGSAFIVSLVALLVGMTTAMQAAYQLRQFGANIYVADLVGIAMMRELGPLMAAIIVAGRSGAAITAEIGTMQVNEEIDALKLIGVNPIQYLAIPRIYAVTITQALLGITAAFVGILGGYVIAMTSLGITASAYLVETLSAVMLDDLIFNLYKSIVFGWIIVTVAVYFGIRVSGGAEGVGRATTNSVVVSIFAIIVADCIFSFV